MNIKNICRVLVRHRGLENSPATTQNSPAKFSMACSSLEGKCFSEWSDSPVTLKYPPATSVLNENPSYGHDDGNDDDFDYKLYY